MPHKMEKVMSEFKAGKLKSGGDKTVTKRKQAIAIGLAMEQKAEQQKKQQEPAKKQQASTTKSFTKGIIRCCYIPMTSCVWYIYCTFFPVIVPLWYLNP